MRRAKDSLLPITTVPAVGASQVCLVIQPHYARAILQPVRRATEPLLPSYMVPAIDRASHSFLVNQETDARAQALPATYALIPSRAVPGAPLP